MFDLRYLILYLLEDEKTIYSNQSFHDRFNLRGFSIFQINLIVTSYMTPQLVHDVRTTLYER